MYAHVLRDGLGPTATKVRPFVDILSKSGVILHVFLIFRMFIMMIFHHSLENGGLIRSPISRG